jgi:hypothetical protein
MKGTGQTEMTTLREYNSKARLDSFNTLIKQNTPRPARLGEFLFDNAEEYLSHIVELEKFRDDIAKAEGFEHSTTLSYYTSSEPHLFLRELKMSFLSESKFRSISYGDVPMVVQDKVYVSNLNWDVSAPYFMVVYMNGSIKLFYYVPKDV